MAQMNYQLVAIDMDGTLLDDQKQLSKRNIASVNKALDKGVTVVFSSGRCMAELLDFFPLFPKMRYVICESGAGVYDLKEKKYVFHKTIDPELTKIVFSAVEGEDIMVQVMMENHNVLNRSFFNNLEHYYMDNYRRQFEKNALVVDNSTDYCASHNYPAAKICLYHTDTNARERTRNKLFHLPLTLEYSEVTSLEVSPLGIDKGTGLDALCSHLGISEKECMVIGDFYNDIPILKKAGLAVAMGNAIPAVKEVCQVVTGDCNHSGVADIIEKYV